MSPSDRFKPIQKVVSQKERKAAVELGESLKQRDEANQRLTELKEYLAEYLERFAKAARNGLTSSQIMEYQVFISKLEAAIEQQEKVVARSERACDSSKQQWRGRYTKSKAMDNAVDRMRLNERKNQDRREQAESDERAQRKR